MTVKILVSDVPSIVFRALGNLVGDFHGFTTRNRGGVLLFFPDWVKAHPGRVVKLVGRKECLEELVSDARFLQVFREAHLISFSEISIFKSEVESWMFVRDRSGDKRTRMEKNGHSYTVNQLPDAFVLPIKSGSNPGGRFFIRIARIPFQESLLNGASSYGLVKQNKNAAGPTLGEESVSNDVDKNLSGATL